MKQKITQWAEQVSTSSKGAWGALAIAISIPALVSLIIGLASSIPTGAAFGNLAMTLVAGFIGAMISAGLLSWASKVLGLEKKGFIRALGVTSLTSLLLLPLSILALVLTALLALASTVIAPILVVVYAGMIVLGIILALFLYAHVYGITKGQAFGLFATAYALLVVILLGIAAIIAFVLSFVIPAQLNNFADFQQVQMESMMESGGFELDEESMVELQAALQGLNETEGLAE